MSIMSIGGGQRRGYKQVANWKALNTQYPPKDYAGEVYQVYNSKRIWPFRKKAGLYRSDGRKWRRVVKVVTELLKP